MTALLTLLLGATAVLVPPGASSDPRRGAGIRSALAQSAALVLGVLLGITILHLPWWQIAVVALTAGLWTALARFAPGPRATLGRWIAAIAVVALCAAIQDGRAGAGVQRLADLCRAAGCFLLLTTPANRVVTDLLGIARGKARTQSTDVLEPEPALRGGRWIGPLERVLMLLLASTGAHQAVAALIAAKGAIRFPEISKDSTETKAEEFLVGSLASWTLAALAAVLLTR